MDLNNSKVVVRLALPREVLLGSLTTMIYHDRNLDGGLDMDLIIDGKRVKPDHVEVMLYNQTICKEKIDAQRMLDAREGESRPND